MDSTYYANYEEFSVHIDVFMNQKSFLLLDLEERFLQDSSKPSEIARVYL